MNSLVLHIFFHGLVAFLPNHDLTQGPSRMTAFLLKGGQHVTSLWFEMNKKSICPETKPGDVYCKHRQSDGLWCVCKLDGDVKISLISNTIGVARSLSSTPEPPTLTSTSRADDFSWLVRMANVSGGAPVRVGDNVSRWVSAEITFGWVGERTCHLDQEGEPQRCETKPGNACKFAVSAFDFDLPARGNKLQLNQPLAEYVMFDTRLLPSGNPGAISLRSTRDSTGVGLILGCNPENCPDLMLSSAYIGPEPSTPAEYDRGDHFKAYYNLAKTPPRTPRIPFRVNTNLSVGDHQLTTCPDDPLSKVMSLEPFKPSKRSEEDKETAEFFKLLDLGILRAASRIVCPMAMFDPPPS
jgi:hypothetical protein